MHYYISIGKAARLLGVCTDTLRNWEKQGILSCFKTVGKHRRYDIRDIVNFLATMKEN